MQPDGIAALRIDAQPRRRNAPTLWLLSDGEHETLLFKFANDGRDGLHGEVDLLGYPAARNRPVQPDGFKHDPAIEMPAGLLVCAFQRHEIVPTGQRLVAQKRFSQIKFEKDAWAILPDRASHG